MLSVIVPTYNEGERVLAVVAHLRRLAGLTEIVLADASDEPESLTVLARLRVDSPGDPSADSNANSPLDPRTDSFPAPPADSPPTPPADARAEPAADSPANSPLDPPSAPPLRLLTHPTPSRAAQMNAGAALASGDILLFLHCDTRLPTAAAAHIRAHLARGHDWGWFALRLDATGAAYRVLERAISARARLTGIATGDQALFVRRPVFAEMGGYADIPLMEDLDLSRRLRRRHPATQIPTPALTSARRWQQHGLLRTLLLMWQLRFRYWRGTPPQELARHYRDAR